MREEREREERERREREERERGEREREGPSLPAQQYKIKLNVDLSLHS